MTNATRLAVLALALTCTTGSDAQNEQSTLLVTSDIHISASDGRWPATTRNREFIDSLDKQPELYRR